jgi:phage terminase
MKYLNALKQYNEENNVKTCKAIKRAFLKHERIHARALEGVYLYRPEVVETAIDFVENEFYKTTGDLELIKLQPAQKWWFELWFGYYTKDGSALINETFLNIIRGAGKSTILAAVEMFWLIFGGNYGGESWIIAYDNNQAEHVFGQVRNQITSGTGLFKMLGDTKQLKTTKTGIRFLPTKNEVRKATHDVSRLQGNNTSLNAFDEVHVYKEDVISAVNKGSRQKQKSWRSIYITSGGITRGYLYDDLITRFKSDEEFENDRSIGLIYQLDNAREVKHEENWSKAAPMIYGGLPKLESVREEYRIASGDNALQLQFLAYNMGIAVNDSAKYITPAESMCKEYDMDAVWSGADVVVGVDMSLTGDLTAVTFLTDVEGQMFAHCEALGSRNTLSQLPDDIAKKLELMIGDGLTITEGAFITAHDVFEIVQTFAERYNCQFTFIGYDPSRYDNLRLLIDDYFFDVDSDRQLAIRQGFALSDYIKLMKDKLADGSLIHNSKILEWSLNNFAVKVGTSGDYMVTKLTNAEKIDPVVALVIALKTAIIKGT